MQKGGAWCMAKHGADCCFENNAAASVFDQYPALHDRGPTGQLEGNETYGGNSVGTQQHDKGHLGATTGLFEQPDSVSLPVKVTV